MPRFRFRSAISGRWVTALFAKLFPFFTVRETPRQKLIRQAKRALMEPEGIDFGPLSHAERDRILFGGREEDFKIGGSE